MTIKDKEMLQFCNELLEAAGGVMSVNRLRRVKAKINKKITQINEKDANNRKRK